MTQAKNIHIVELSKNLVERLTFINVSPNYILSEGVDIDLIKKIYPEAQFLKEGRVDLILGAVVFSPKKDLAELLVVWQKSLKAGGLLLFGLLNFEADIQELGDHLLSLGYLNVVIDCEEGAVYVHAMGRKAISIKANQIRRAG